MNNFSNEIDQRIIPLVGKWEAKKPILNPSTDKYELDVKNINEYYKINEFGYITNDDGSTNIILLDELKSLYNKIDETELDDEMLSIYGNLGLPPTEEEKAYKLEEQRLSIERAKQKKSTEKVVEVEKPIEKEKIVEKIVEKVVEVEKPKYQSVGAELLDKTLTMSYENDDQTELTLNIKLNMSTEKVSQIIKLMNINENDIFDVLNNNDTVLNKDVLHTNVIQCLQAELIKADI